MTYSRKGKKLFKKDKKGKYLKNWAKVNKI